MIILQEKLNSVNHLVFRSLLQTFQNSAGLVWKCGKAVRRRISIYATFFYQKSPLWSRVAFFVSLNIRDTCARRNTQSWCILVDSSTYILQVLSFDPSCFFYVYCYCSSTYIQKVLSFDPFFYRYCSNTYILKVLSFDPFWFFIFKFHVINDIITKQCFASPLNILF